jgi:hypothetical protein
VISIDRAGESGNGLPCATRTGAAPGRGADQEVPGWHSACVPPSRSTRSTPPLPGEPAEVVSGDSSIARSGDRYGGVLPTGSWPNARSAWPRTGPWRSAAGPPPDLLVVEQRLVAAATGRAGEQTAVASHQAVHEALAAHPSAGTDQQAMVRDLCQGGQGSPWSSGGPGRARPSPSVSPAMPGSWTATGCWPRPRPGSRP